MEIFQNYSNEILLFLISFLFILLIWNIILQLKLTGLKKRFIRFTKGNSVGNLEDLIIAYTNEITTIKETQEMNSENIKNIVKKIEQQKGNVGITRYNAFSDTGSDLSFSIALLDDQRNGVVITSIYNREQSNTYAKPIEKGTSNYRLSEEEKKAIELALR